MRISVNLASRPFADLGPALKRLRIAMGVMAAVAIALGFGLHALHSKAEAARAREHSLDGAIGRVNQERQGYQNMMRQPDNAQVLAQSEALNKLLDEKSFSWTLAMEDLETVLPGGVMATTLEPIRDSKTGDITLHLRVIGPRDLAIKLVANLEHSRRFRQPRIVGESAEVTGGPGERLAPVSLSNRVNFDVLADYIPATPEERKAGHQKSEAVKTHEHETSGPTEPRHVRPAKIKPGLGRPPMTGVSHPGPVIPHASGGGPR